MMSRHIIVLSLLVLCARGQTMSDDKVYYPDPRVVIVGPTGAGKSSLANALLGCDPRDGGCLFGVCGSLNSCTNETKIGKGFWQDGNRQFTVVDTPGFGDSYGRENDLIRDMMEVLDNKLGYTNIILLLLDGNTPRFTPGLFNMLAQMSAIFGEKWWDFMMIGVSKWSYQQRDIDARQDDCKYYGDPSDNCKNEAWIKREISAKLQEKFHLNKNLTFVFLEAWSQTVRNLNDETQQRYWKEETDKLWREATANNETFDFKTIDEVLQENARFKREIKQLNNIIDEKFKELYDAQNETKDMISDLSRRTTDLSSDITENKDMISDLSSRTQNQISDLSSRTTDLSSEITENKDMISDLSSSISDHETSINGLNTKTNENEESIRTVQNLPFGYFCGYQDEFSAANSVIKYDKLLLSHHRGLQGDSPGININTGKFVSGLSGTWRVDFSLRTAPDPREYIFIYLYKNGVKITETEFYSYRTRHASGRDYNTGGRSLLVKLNSGDQLSLRTNTMEDQANNIIFCVSLEQSDV